MVEDVGKREDYKLKINVVTIKFYISSLARQTWFFNDSHLSYPPSVIGLLKITSENFAAAVIYAIENINVIFIKPIPSDFKCRSGQELFSSFVCKI